MCQLFLFDVDGTLVDSHTHIVPESTKQVLNKLKQDGHIIGISTGRSLDSIVAGGFTDLVSWDILLCNNGQAIYDHDHNPIHIACISKESVLQCIEVANAMHSPLFIMADQNFITQEPNEDVYASLDFFKETLPPIQDYDEQDVIMMIAYGPNGYDYEQYRQIDGIDVIPGLSNYADIVLKGYHKYIGIQHALAHFQMDEYIAFGDSLNDMEMIEHASIGIAMGDAHDELKSIADYVTDCVMDDGIYHALQKFHILP